MRILHIIGTLNPESGGPAAAVATLNKFRAQGSVNEVVTLDDPDAAFLRELDFRITALGPTGTKYGYNAALVPWLKANASRFDGVVVHGLWQYCGYAARKAFGGNKPYMVFVHGMLDPYFKRAFPLKHMKKWIYWALVEHWVLRGAYRVLFTCNEEERLARQSFWLHSWTPHIVSLGASIPEGDDPEADKSERRLAFLDRFPQLEGRRYLLFLGRIDRKKGCDLLIKAFLRAAPLDPDLDLVMAGPDENNWRDQLEALVSAAGLASRVHWTGMLAGDAKWGAFLCSEVFILPSHQENFGIAVTEAMACGRAVLLSDKVNIAPDIAVAGAGLMDTDTEEGTFRLIAAWISLPRQQRLAMGASASRLFAARYDMRTRGRDIAVLLREANQADLTELPTPASAVK
jgi:glycosyltransferase involved in cell wall biosynthesis